MKKWYLYRNQYGVIKKINEAYFDSPYQAFEALRMMSYAIRDAGLDAKVRGTGSEPELELDKNNSFRYSENADLETIKLPFREVWIPTIELPDVENPIKD